MRSIHGPRRRTSLIGTVLVTVALAFGIGACASSTGATGGAHPHASAAASRVHAFASSTQGQQAAQTAKTQAQACLNKVNPQTLVSAQGASSLHTSVTTAVKAVWSCFRNLAIKSWTKLGLCVRNEASADKIWLGGTGWAKFENTDGPNCAASAA